MATCCHFLAVGQLYGFSGSLSQSEASASSASAFSLWAVPPFLILSTAKSLSAPDPDAVFSSSGNEEPRETPPLALSGPSFVVLVTVSSILGHREYMQRVIDRSNLKELGLLFLTWAFDICLSQPRALIYDQIASGIRRADLYQRLTELFSSLG